MANKYKFIIAGAMLLVVVLLIFDRIGFTIKEKPRLIKTVMEINKTRELLNQIKNICGKYPQQIVSYKDLQDKIKNKDCSEKITSDLKFKDEWGNSYIYLIEKDGYRILSAGSEWLEASDNMEAEIVKKKE